MCWFVLQNLDRELRLSSCDITVYRCREQVCLTLARWVIFRVQKVAHQKVPNASEKAVAVVETGEGERDTGKWEKGLRNGVGPCAAITYEQTHSGPKGIFQYTDKRNIVFTAPKYLKFPGKSPCGWNLLSLLDDGGSAHCDLQCRRKFSVVFPRSVPRYSRVGRLHFCLCSNMHW